MRLPVVVQEYQEKQWEQASCSSSSYCRVHDAVHFKKSARSRFSPTHAIQYLLKRLRAEPA